jgi:hypothetical protein
MMDGLAIKVVAGIDGMDVARLREMCNAMAARELRDRVGGAFRGAVASVP